MSLGKGSCSSTSGQFEITAMEAVEVAEGLGTKAKHANVRKPFIEQRSGGELFRKTSKITDRSLIIDRENDLYT